MNISCEFKDSPVGRIPKTWKVKKLEDVISIKHGFAFDGEFFTNTPNDWILLTPGNFHRDGQLYFGQNTKYFAGDIPDEYVLENGDLLIVMTDLTKEMTILGNAIILCSTKGVLHNQRIGKISIKEEFDEDISKEFVCTLLNSRYVKKWVKLTATGTTVRHSSPSKILAIEIPLPNSNEQQKIASILTSVDTVIEKTEAQINKLKDLKKAMMQELLTKGIGHTEFKDSPVGRIPVGWEVVTIKDMIADGILDSIQDGNHGAQHPRADDFSDEGIPFIMASDIKYGALQYNLANKIPYDIYKEMRIGFSISGDVLLTHKATIGLTAIVPKQAKEIMLTPQVTYYRIKDASRLLNTYLQYWFQSDWFQESMSTLSAQSTRSYIGITAQKELLVVLPCFQEQQKITSILTSLDNIVNKRQGKLSHTKSLKKALMQDLLTGKVRVAV
jgi:type I restriction enzyme, S subunit